MSVILVFYKASSDFFKSPISTPNFSPTRPRRMPISAKKLRLSVLRFPCHHLVGVFGPILLYSLVFCCIIINVPSFAPGDIEIDAL